MSKAGIYVENVLRAIACAVILVALALLGRRVTSMLGINGEDKITAWRDA